MYGLTTPRDMIKEQVRAWKKERGTEFKVKRFRQIYKHLAKCYLPRCPIPVLDMPLHESELKEVIQEAFAAVQAKDEIKDMIMGMAAQGRA